MEVDKLERIIQERYDLCLNKLVDAQTYDDTLKTEFVSGQADAYRYLLKRIANQPQPPPNKVIIQPPSSLKMEGLYVNADDYLKSYLKSKFQEDEIPINYSIIGLLVVIIILLVYLCVKVSD